MKHSKDTKRKISESRIKGFKEGKINTLGKNNGMFGKKHTEITKKRISETRIKEEISKGKKNPMYGIKRFGKNNPMFGKKRPDIVEYNRKYKSAQMQGINHPNYGKENKWGRHSKDTKLLMSKNSSKYWKNKKFSNIHKQRLKDKRKFIVLPIKDTSIEIKIQNYLKQLNIDFFTHQYIKEIEHGYQCDILIPSKNLVIECDGDYWHKYPIGTEVDHIRTKELIEKGFKVLRLWEFEIKKMELNEFKEKLKIIN